MDNAKTLKCEKSSKKSSNRNETEIENLSKLKSLEVAPAINSEQQSKNICKEREDVEDKPDDSHTRSEVKNNRQTGILAQQDEANLHFSSLTKKRKVMKHETISRTNPVNIKNNVKFGRADKSQRRRTISLRRKILEIMTKKKSLSQADGSFELSYKSNKSQSEFQDLQDKKSRIPDEGKENARNDSHGSFVTKSSCLNELRFQSTSSNRSQVPTNKNQPSSSAESASAPINFHVSVTKSQSTKIKSAKEVWAHFIGFLQTNKESFDRIMTSSISRESMEISNYANNILKDATNIVKESTSQSLGEPAKTKTEYGASEIPDNLRSEISSTRDFNLVPVVIMIQQLRSRVLKEIRRCEEFLMSKKVDAQQEKNMKKKIKFLIDAKGLQRKLHRYYDVLCDHEKIFNILKQEKIYLLFAKDNLSPPTSLTDLPLSATHIRTFSSLFLYQHKSLYSEVPIENVFKRIKSENFALAYQRYRERKTKNEMEILENVAFKLIVCLNISLEECRLKLKNEIPHSENRSLEDYQNYINDLRKAINENFNCLKVLFSVGSSVTFPVGKYLSESRKRTLLELLFLDKRRPDVFP